MKLPRLAGWTLAALCVIVVVGILGVRFWLEAYLRGPKFREALSLAAARSLHADGEFLPLHFTGATAYSGGFEARGTDEAFFSKLRADELRAELDWRGLLQRKWTVTELAIQRLDVSLASRPRASAPSQLATEERIETRTPGQSWRLDLKKAVVNEAGWRWGGASVPAGEFSGTALTIVPNGDAFSIDAVGGRLAQTGWPELTLESAKARWQKPSLFITDAQFRRGEGRLGVTGEINVERGSELQVDMTGIDITPLLTGDWKLRLFGKLSGRARVRLPESPGGLDGLLAEGSLRLTEGRLEALPVLNHVAAFTRTQRFRQLALNQASVDFTADRGRLSGRNLVMESSGLVRVEGAFVVENGRIDGTFEMGVTSASLQWLPGSQARVFTVARDGYLWTPVKLTGPVEHPSEDLTPRLVAAVGESFFDVAPGAAKDAEGKVRDAAKEVLDLLLR